MNAISHITKYDVRKATETDAGEVLRLYVENLVPIAHITPSIPTMGNEIWQAIKLGRVFVATDEDRIVGCASYAMSRYWYVEEEMLFDTGFFVIPEYRKSRAAYLLFAALKDEARKLGTCLIMGAGTKDPTVAPTMAKRYTQIASAFLVRP